MNTRCFALLALAACALAQCPADTKPCADGSTVGRDPEFDCEIYYKCPGGGCPVDTMKCPDGTMLARDLEFDCDFPGCPAGQTREPGADGDGQYTHKPGTDGDGQTHEPGADGDGQYTHEPGTDGDGQQTHEPGTDGDGQHTSEPATTQRPQRPGCPTDTMTCTDGTVLERDPEFDCNFPDCPVVDNTAAPVTQPTDKPATGTCETTVGEWGNCLRAQGCCAAGLVCYEQNQYYAQCLKEGMCKTEDNVWSCKQLGKTPPAPQPTTATSGSCETTIPMWGTCTNNHDCCEAGLTCFEQTEHYAQCRKGCLKKDDWSCKVVGGEVPEFPDVPGVCIAVWKVNACEGENEENCHTCGDRITTYIEEGMAMLDAMNTVAADFNSVCGACHC